MKSQLPVTLLLALTTAVAYAACGGDEAPDAVPASIVLTPSSASLPRGDTTRLSAVVKNAAGAPLTGQTVSYVSSATTIATVSSSGLVTALGSTGTASITASAGSATSPPAMITVVPAAAKTLAKSTDLSPSPAAGSSNTVSVKVTDSFGTGVAGTSVTFAVTAGGGSVTAATATSDATGTASSSFKLGNTVGVNTATASAAGLTGSPITFSATSVAGAPANVAKAGTDPTNLGPAATVANWVSVLVTDALGNPKSGVSVGFAVAAGGGSITPAAATTDASGKASAAITSGATAGTNTFTAAVSGLPAVSFTTTTVPPAPVATVAVTLPGTTLLIGSSTQAEAVTKDANSNVLTGRAVTWTSGNAAVATVNAAGLVNAVSAGTTSITAASEGKTGSAAVTVTTVAVSSVTVTLASSTVIVGGATQATAVLKDAAGTVLSGRPLTWSSSNSAVATVSTAGLVSAVAAGAATVSATSEGKTGSASLTVSAAVASVTVTLAPSTILVGGTSQASAVLKDAAGNVLAGRTVAWTSSSSAVATVSSSGLVTGAGGGTATISATSEGMTGTASLTVTAAPVASVTVTLPGTTLAVGISVQATVVTKDANGNVLTGRVVTWASGNTSVATVSATGMVSAIAPGTSTITATSEGRAGSVTVTVVVGGPALITAYDGTYLGQFDAQWEYDVITFVGSTRVTTTTKGSYSFSVSVTLRAIASLNGVVFLMVTHATTNNAYFGCQIAGCDSAQMSLWGPSMVVLPYPPVNVSTSDLVGFSLSFPNQSTLDTYGPLHMSTDGRIISNTLDPASTWHALDLSPAHVNFDQYQVPEGFKSQVDSFRVPKTSWTFTKSNQ